MNPYISSVPMWVITAFILSFIISTFSIVQIVRKTSLSLGFHALRIRNISIGIFGFYTAYFFYVSALSLNGVFSTNTLPPRILLLTALPMAFFLFGMARLNTTFHTLLEATPLEDLVGIHRFRIVGGFFLVAAFYGELPTRFALLAGFGDIFSALGAIMVARATKNRKEWSFAAVIGWNIFGVLDILNVLVMALFAAREAILTGGRGVSGITEFPFSWIPAFAPPTILFLHFQVFKRLKAYKQSLVNAAMVP